MLFKHMRKQKVSSNREYIKELNENFRTKKCSNGNKTLNGQLKRGMELTEEKKSVDLNVEGQKLSNLNNKENINYKNRNRALERDL